MSVCRRTLFSVWCDEKDHRKKFSVVKNYVFSNVIDKSKFTEEESDAIEKRLKRLCTKLTEKWRVSKRSWKWFETKNKAWLDGEINLSEPNIPARAGRQEKDFTDCHTKHEATNACDELTVAARVSLYKAEKRMSYMSILETNSDVGNKMKRSVEADLELPIKYTPEEALALFIDGNYTKSCYKLMQAGAKMRGADIYPTYGTLRYAKSRCYPNEVKVTEYSAEVPLQELLDHTITRIVEGNLEAFSHINFDGQKYKTLTAIYKWGCEGSSGLNGFSNSEYNMIDEQFFAICIVPLQVQLGNSILWKNPRPSSSRYCRPLKILFEKETTALVRTEVANVKAQIMKITPTELSPFHVQHHLQMSMIDGKVLSIIAESSSETRGICKALPINSFNAVPLPINRLAEEALGAINPMQELMNSLLISSDPLISTLSKNSSPHFE